MSPGHLALLVAVVMLINMAISGTWGYFLGLKKGRKR